MARAISGTHNDFSTMTDSVLIVGAGPTGLTLAIELARRAVPFDLIDQRTAPLQSDRAAFVKSRSLEIFKTYGLADLFVRCGQVINGFDIFSGGVRQAWFRLGDIDSPFPYFLGISESKTEELLTVKLNQLGHQIERSVSFIGFKEESNGLSVRLSSKGREEERTYNWLVAADGSHSGVREASRIDFPGHEYACKWGVVDARIERWNQPADIVASQFDPVIYAAPIGAGRRRIYFRAKQNGTAILDDVEQQVARIALGLRLVDADKPQLFKSQFRIAAHYRAGRVLLAGDAAHTISPTQAHGMNTGIQDSFNIGWKLALVAQGRAKTMLLDSYEAERRPVAQVVGASGDEMESLIAKGDPEATNTIREALATDNSRLQVALAESETTYRYDRSTIVGEYDGLNGSPLTEVGCRVGDAGPLTGRNESLSLHQILAHGGHTLFWLLGDSSRGEQDRACAIVGEFSERYGELVKAFVITTGRVEAPHNEIAPLLLDENGSLHERLCGQTPSLSLVRPDGHLGFRCAPPSVVELDQHLSQVII